MMSKPLTCADLAEALGCFWNAALEAERFCNATPVGAIVQGVAAVAERLREIDAASRDAPPVAAPASPSAAAPPRAQKPALAANSGDTCRACGNFSLVRTGTCLTCQVCGETSGCS